MCERAAPGQSRNPEETAVPVPIRADSARLEEGVGIDPVQVRVAAGDQTGVKGIGLGGVDAPHRPAAGTVPQQLSEVGQLSQMRQVNRRQTIYGYDNHAPAHSVLVV